MFILTTTMASHSLYWIYSLLFLVAYTLWQPFVAYFRSDIDIIVFFGWAGCPKVGGAGDGKHKKKYGHPYIKSQDSCQDTCIWTHAR